MGWFKFGNVTSEELGLRIESFPDIQMPEIQHERYSVPGRGDDVIDYYWGVYKNVTRRYDVYFGNNVDGAAHAMASNIIKQLYRQMYEENGYVELTDSYDPAYIREAVFLNGFEAQNVLNKYGRATLEFECKAYKRQVALDPAREDTKTLGDAYVDFKLGGAEGEYIIGLSESSFATAEDGAGTLMIECQGNQTIEVNLTATANPEPIYKLNGATIILDASDNSVTCKAKDGTTIRSRKTGSGDLKHSSKVKISWTCDTEKTDFPIVKIQDFLEETL